MDIKLFFSTVGAFFSFWKIWRLAAEKATLEQREKHLESEKARISLLVQKDSEMRASETHGIIMEVKQPARARWLNANTVECDFQIIFRNRWVYPVTLDRILGTIDEPTWGEICELNPYFSPTRLEGLSDHAISRKFSWSMTAEQAQRTPIKSNRSEVPYFTAKLEAWLIPESNERFRLSQALTFPGLLDPIRTIETKL